uniref:Uncharacterized protein n=1 Tax=Avena sativa TaxID=4498 RepID=A0ACD5UR14_AVESA
MATRQGGTTPGAACAGRLPDLPLRTPARWFLALACRGPPPLTRCRRRARDATAEGARAGTRVQDRLVWPRPDWQEPRLSRKTRWRRRKAAQREAEAAGRRPVSPEWTGRCFNCGRPGHRKKKCTFEPLCLRCSQVGHETYDYKRPRSPDSEDELRRQALAKFARQASPPNLLRSPQLREQQVVPRAGAEGETPEFDMVDDLEEEEESFCVVRRTPAMQDLEWRLRFAMVAYVGGARPKMSCEQVQEALVRGRGVPSAGFSVHPYSPEDFLVVFASEELRSRVSARPSLEHRGFSLFFRKWTRQSQASMEVWRSKVSLIIEGVPPHAWDREVVRDLLGSSCAILEVAPETASRADLSSFKLTAWTGDVDRIPPARTLVVPEPEEAGEDTPSPPRATSANSRDTPPARPPSEKKMLKYKVLIHIDMVEEEDAYGDHRAVASLGVQGNRQAEQRGERGASVAGAGNGRTSRRLPWRRGVPDQRGGRFRSSARLTGQSRTYCQVAASMPPSWRLPPMEDQRMSAPMTAGQGRPEANSKDILEKGAAGQAGGSEAIERQLFSPDKGTLGRCPDPEGSRIHEELGVGTNESPTLVTTRQFLEVVAESAMVQKEMGTGLENTANLAQDLQLEPSVVVQRTEPAAMEDGQALTEEGLDGSLEAAGSPVQLMQGDFFQVSLSADASAGERPGSPVTPTSKTQEHGSWPTNEMMGSPISPLESFSQADSEMQFVRKHGNVVERDLSAGEKMALAKMKEFCSRILKALAPPLLKEVERTSSLRPSAEPFTPRRSGRVSNSAKTTGKLPQKATAAESALLKALGITASDLTADEAALREFRQFFDSPIRERQLHVLAAIFGKTMPAPCDLLQQGLGVPCACT